MVTRALEPLAHALGLFGQLVDAVGPEQWSLPTLCDPWDVQQLVGHVVSGQWLFSRVLRGDPLEAAIEEAGRAWTGQRVHDPSADYAAEYRRSAEALLAAFGEPGALERVVTVPAGTVPGAVAEHLRVTEVLVHGWDVARATRLPFDVPTDLARRELAFSRPMLERVPPERRSFAVPRPISDDAPALDRLAALLGRDPAADC